MSKPQQAQAVRPRRGAKSSPGIVLVLTAGILAILTALGAAFFTIAHMELTATVRYQDMVQCEMTAQAGLADAVAQLRKCAQEETEAPNAAWFPVNYLKGEFRKPSLNDLSANGLDDDGDRKADNAAEASLPFSGKMLELPGVVNATYTLQVEDAAGKINVNAGDNVAVILDNLCRLLGPPLVAADGDMLQPRRWYAEGADSAYNWNPTDTAGSRDAYFRLGADGRPITWNEFRTRFGGAAGAMGIELSSKPSDGYAVYGDGYAIAGWRALHGRFRDIQEVRQALTFVDRNGNGRLDDPLEALEVEVKFACLRPYLTLHSWVDTNTVCVGKFEWVEEDVELNGQYCQVLVDRDKSWIADDATDTRNDRGSLRGSYVSIMNGHGAGQLRRICTNGADWIAIKSTEKMVLPPGPISSYMIIAKEDATPDPYDPNNGVAAERLDFTPAGDLKDDPNVDYSVRPLCIHRAPVNINTASPAVLAALFMGLNVQHGHPLAIGTDADANKLSKAPLPVLYSYGVDNSPANAANALPAPPKVDAIAFTGGSATDWKAKDNVLQLESYLLTPRGIKRIPADAGKLIFSRNLTTFLSKYGLSKPDYDLDYVNQFGGQAEGTGLMNEAQELALRIVVARQRSRPLTATDPDPILKVDTGKDVERGPFRDWDDFYFRIVRPWDDARYAEDQAADGVQNKVLTAKMLMAHFNSNTDILKFNPNIEWIDRWGRNFTEMEPVMVFSGSAPAATKYMWAQSRPTGAPKGAWLTRSLRYKSDEMIDKTDLNRGTTEFSFDSNGTFDVVSTGLLLQPWNRQVLSERRMEASVKVYDVWRESTQRQFVRGRISQAARSTRSTLNGVTSSGFSDAGRIARDSLNDAPGATLQYKALDTLPEPLAPLAYRIANPNGLSDMVDSTLRDVWKNAKSGGAASGYLPDIVANRVLPARYDGQVVLATNTAAYDPAGSGDTFLASFDGDVDTCTSAGNGREQAKTPGNRQVRVADTIGLLGLMNDAEIDVDPDPTNVGSPMADIYISKNVDIAGIPLTSTDPVTGTANAYSWWSNQAVRMGDLRADGAFCGAMGTSLKEGCLKYLYDATKATEGGNKEPAPAPKNFYPGSPDGFTISMWFKPNWHGADGREHVFFDGGRIGDTSNARYCHLYKAGRFSFAKRYGVAGGDGSSATWERNNDLVFGTEDGDRRCVADSDDDEDFMTFLHGGTRNVGTNLPTALGNPKAVTPAFSVQPFRWGYVGAKFTYKKQVTVAPPTSWGTVNWGYWFSNPTQASALFKDACVRELGHAFTNTQRDGEGAGFSPQWYYQYSQELWGNDATGKCLFQGLGAADIRGQAAAYSWAQYADGNKRQAGVFSVCNVNEGQDKWLYRATPLDGAYAVLDEYRISKKAWDSNMIAAEMTTSRYYLPADPTDARQCPYFLSQTLFESLKGAGASGSETVSLVRVSWTVFTPRFMHEYKAPGTYRRKEIAGAWDGTRWAPGAVTVDYRGPFDACQYNRDAGYDAFNGWKHESVNPYNPLYGVDRPMPAPNVQTHATKGVEVELWKGTAITDRLSGLAWDPATRTFASATTFTNPAVLNTFAPGTRVAAKDLRYCVRFRYPVDPQVDPKAGSACVDGLKQYLVDTPVFDDISVAYFSTARILEQHDVRE